MSAIVLADPRDQARQAALQNLSAALQGHFQKKQQANQQSALAQQFGLDLPENLDPNTFQLALKLGIEKQIRDQDTLMIKDFLNGGIEGPPTNESETSASSRVDQATLSSVADEVEESKLDKDVVKKTQPKTQKLSDTELAKLAASPNTTVRRIAQSEKARREFDLKERQFTDKKFQKEREFHQKQALPFLLDIDKERSTIDEQEQALQQADFALANANLGFFSSDNLANLLGPFGGAFRTLEGQQLQNARKEFLLAGIGRAGSRPNQWIEQQISSMLFRAGISEQANRGLAEVTRNLVDNRRLRIDIADELAAEDREKFGFEKRDISSRVSKEMKPRVKELQNRLSYRLRELHEQEQGIKALRKNAMNRVPTGTPLTPTMIRVFKERIPVEKIIPTAKKLGYTIPTTAEIQRWQLEQ